MTVVVWRAVIEQGLYGRYVLVHDLYAGLAWSGSAWVPHRRGVGTGRAQVSTFTTWNEAYEYAQENGLAVVTYRLGEDGRSITCLRCNLTSHNPHDVEQRYCGNCRLFMDAQ